jgi:hypothetical protein
MPFQEGFDAPSVGANGAESLLRMRRGKRELRRVVKQDLKEECLRRGILGRIEDGSATALAALCAW